MRVNALRTEQHGAGHKQIVVICFDLKEDRRHVEGIREHKHSIWPFEAWLIQAMFWARRVFRLNWKCLESTGTISFASRYDVIAHLVHTLQHINRNCTNTAWLYWTRADAGVVWRRELQGCLCIFRVSALGRMSIARWDVSMFSNLLTSSCFSSLKIRQCHRLLWT